jgi:hypothetical protein
MDRQFLFLFYFTIAPDGLAVPVLLFYFTTAPDG